MSDHLRAGRTGGGVCVAFDFLRDTCCYSFSLTRHVTRVDLDAAIPSHVSTCDSPSQLEQFVLDYARQSQNPSNWLIQMHERPERLAKPFRFLNDDDLELCQEAMNIGLQRNFDPARIPYPLGPDKLPLEGGAFSVFESPTISRYIAKLSQTNSFLSPEKVPPP